MYTYRRLFLHALKHLGKQDSATMSVVPSTKGPQGLQTDVGALPAERAKKQNVCNKKWNAVSAKSFSFQAHCIFTHKIDIMCIKQYIIKPWSSFLIAFDFADCIFIVSLQPLGCLNEWELTCSVRDPWCVWITRQKNSKNVVICPWPYQTHSVK